MPGQRPCCARTRFRAVAGLNVPPILPGGTVPPSITRTEYGEGVYQVCFQQQGVAEPARRAGGHRGLRLVPEHRTQQRTARTLPGSRDRRSCAECGGRPRHDHLVASPDGGSSLSEVCRGRGGSDNSLSAVAPQTHGPVALPVCGHWTQQKRLAEVNAALLDFLNRIDGSASRRRHAASASWPSEQLIPPTRQRTH